MYYTYSLSVLWFKKNYGMFWVGGYFCLVRMGMVFVCVAVFFVGFYSFSYDFFHHLYFISCRYCDFIVTICYFNG